MQEIYTRYIDKPIVKHTIFWVVVYMFYITSARERFTSTEELLVTYFFHVLYAVIIAYTTLHGIIPTYKKKKRIVELVLAFALLFFTINLISVVVRVNFLEKTYPECYRVYLESNGEQSLLDRLLDWYNIFVHIPFFYMQPLFFLVALQFYENQFKLSQVNEQKKIAELSALKNQLNPHFLFNTLNNLYALTVEKSDRAPEVIEKLSQILDYMLYGTESTYVPLHREVEMLENYLSLEQVRYEDRVIVSFQNDIREPVKIAPLILLTFVENAFKHGVSQELNMANIKIKLTLLDHRISFYIENTKPSSSKHKSIERKKIGLSNVEKQLDLLYPEAHTLHIEETDEKYIVNLLLENRS